MSIRRRCLLAALPLAVVGWTLAQAFAQVSRPSKEAARLDRYVKADGENFFALSLSPALKQRKAEAMDVVVMFDTSASQAGGFRDKALASLDTLLSALGPKDRVRLFAVDIDAVPLTDSFVSAAGGEMRQALEQLRARAPLGSTDMETALVAAAESYTRDMQNPRAAVYIGDGMSTANLLADGQMRQVVDALVSRRIPVSSFAIGPRMDTRLLAALSNHTGGVLAVDGERIAAADAGNFLGAAARQVVAWPTDVKLPESITEVYPGRVPPLRADRDTVVIGRGAGEEPLEIEITADVAGGRPTTMHWTVRPGKPSEDHAYLGRLVAEAIKDGGLSLTTLGSAGLRFARQALAGDAHQFNRLAQQAAATGNLDQAQRLAEAALARDPHDPAALAVVRHVGQARENGDAGEPRELRLVNFQSPDEPAPADAEPITEEPFAADGAFADEVARQREVVTAYMRTLVRTTVDEARRIMSGDPKSAMTSLKMLLEDVRQAPELVPDVRGQLVGQIVAALRTADVKVIEKDKRDIELLDAQAARRQQEQLARELTLKEERVEQLMVRANSLMVEGRFLDANLEAGRAREIDPTSPGLTAAFETAQLHGFHRDAMALRDEKYLNILHTLNAVEHSAVPFPDEPPVVYPPPEVWRRLTAAREQYKEVDLAISGPAERKILAELDEPTDLAFIDAPLSDVILYLKDFHGIEIVPDQLALDDAGVGTDQPVTIELSGISLRSALRIMLRNLQLTFVVQDEVLMITTPEEQENRLITKVYPVADLVVPIVNVPLGGGGGGLGGGGQGGGGFGGGGGGFGGGGGGFGGGGGGFGGGGGGFFNVPAEPLRPFHAFAVKDELRLSSSKTSAAKAGRRVAGAATTPRSTVPAPPKAIQLKVAAGADPEQAWNDYFASHRPSPADVRQTVRRLLAEKKFAQIVALVNGALRNRQMQSWMYEVMGLAMEAAGYPDHQRERALMSAADFAEGSLDLMYLAYHLGNSGLEQRSLKLFRQVARTDPTRHEPYMYGLKLARKLSDLDGIRWSTIGILSQAWPQDKADVWKTARRVARATLVELEESDRSVEARQYAADLRGALHRDCLVVVTWTGEADVDLYIEEPTGTVCSLRNPRTTAGGVMLGDAVDKATGAAGDASRSETYVCAKAFDGAYRVMLRRIWGDLAAGKVTVDIFTNYGADDAQHQRRQIALGDEPAAVVFELDGGRRTDLLKDHQVATAVATQAKVGQQILAQQLAGLDNSGVIRDLAAGRQRILGGNGLLGRRGAVGFQPVIITLPQGANMSATAVVSADRRYVRISASPIFSQITNVTVFNFATGNSQQGMIPPGGGLGGTAGGFGGGGQGGGGQGGGGFGF